MEAINKMMAKVADTSANHNNVECVEFNVKLQMCMTLETAVCSVKRNLDSVALFRCRIRILLWATPRNKGGVRAQVDVETNPSTTEGENTGKY